MARKKFSSREHKVRKQPTPEGIDFSKIRGRIQAALEGKGAETDVNERGEVVFKGGAGWKAGKRSKQEAGKAFGVPEIPRLKLGIPGVDELITEGVPRGSTILLLGGPGSGKTIFSIQYLVAGAEKYGEPGVYVSFEETEASVRESAELFGWNMRELEKNKLLEIIWRDPYEIKTFAKAMGGQIYYTLKEIGAKRIVFDSITYFSLTEENRFKLRKEISELSKRLKAMGVTSIFISEVPEAESDVGRFGMEEFVADGVIHLHNFLVRDTRQRALEVLKLRKTAHDTFLHPFKITRKGFEVFPQEQVFKE